MKLHELQDFSEWENFTDIDETAPVTADKLREQCPDAMWLVLGNDESVLARCSLWWRETPILEGQPVGAIGHFAALNRDAGCMVLAHAVKQLTERGCRLGRSQEAHRLGCRRGGPVRPFRCGQRRHACHRSVRRRRRGCGVRLGLRLRAQLGRRRQLGRGPEAQRLGCRHGGSVWPVDRDRRRHHCGGSRQ